MIDFSLVSHLIHDIGSAVHNAGPDKGWWPAIGGSIFGSYQHIMKDAVIHKVQENQQEQPHQPQQDNVDQRIKSLL